MENEFYISSSKSSVDIEILAILADLQHCTAKENMHSHRF